MDPTGWLQLLDRYGIPMSMLFALAFAAWRIIRWVRPWAEKFFSVHFEFVEKTGNTLERFAERTSAALESTGDAITKQSELMENFGVSIEGFKTDNGKKFAKLDEIKKDVQDLHPKVDNIARKLDELPRMNGGEP